MKTNQASAQKGIRVIGIALKTSATSIWTEKFEIWLHIVNSRVELLDYKAGQTRLLVFC